MSDEEDILRVEDLTVNFITYEGWVKVLDDISFSVKRGEVFGIVGESGSGKSVTAKAILGILPVNAVIKKGKIFYNGINLLLNPKKHNEIKGKEITIILQNPLSALNPLFKIRDQLINIIKYRLGIGGDEAESYIKGLLKKVELPDPERILNSYPYELSGGMAQRVMIGMAISTKPKLLIADEPTTALDVTIQAQILNLLKKLNRELGLTIIIITHDFSIISYLCDRVMVLYAGQIMEISPLKEILLNPVHPYTRELIKSVPRPEYRGRELPYIEGDVPSLLDPPNGCRFHPRCKIKSDICTKNKPILKKIGKDHYVACWNV